MQGPLALYKGILPPLSACTPMYALCFVGYNQGKKIFCVGPVDLPRHFVSPGHF